MTKISEIRVWQVDLPLVEGRYSWASGKSVEVFDSTVIEIRTDDGICGYAECCPLGSVYLPSYAEGVRTGIGVIAPALIGANPLAIGEINRLMDSELLGHPYVKAPLDIACWDILAKAAGMPLYMLLGGKRQVSIQLYRAISQTPPQIMAENVAGYRQEGYRLFQLKVGADPVEDIERIAAARNIIDQSDTLFADANTGWLKHEAARVVDAVDDLDVYIEQPCASYEDCLSIRRRTARPFTLDETITGTSELVRALADDAMDVINLKISKVGGLTRARLMRDLCIETGIPMIIEDTWGGDIVTATIASLAQSTPADFCLAATDFNSYVTVSNASGSPSRVQGRMHASDGHGLGIEPDFAVLGDPVMVINS